MGWSWAPFVAQALAMGLLVIATAKWHTRAFDNDTGIPRYITIQRGLSTAQVYLTHDNIAVIADDVNFAKAIQASIKERLAESSLPLKEEQFVSPEDLRKPETGAVHLGVELRWKGSLQVRVAEKTVSKWRSFIDTLRAGKDTTKRDVAKVIGIILHSRRVRLLSVAHAHVELDALRALHPISSWNAPAEVSSELLAHATHICVNDWSSITAFTARTKKDMVWCDEYSDFFPEKDLE